jgi:hypothetical protein
LSTPAIHFRALVSAWCALAAVSLVAQSAYAQRVEFPSQVPGSTPYAGSSVYPTNPAGSSVYPATPGTPVYQTPGASSVYPGTPQPSLPAYPPTTPAPSFEPYGTPPADVPYASPYANSPYTVNPQQPVVGAPYPSAPYPATPYAGTPAPATGSTLFENSSTPKWSNGATYNYQNPDGSVAKLQRLMQQISVEHTFLYGEHQDIGNLEINRLELAATFAVPAFYNPNTPFLITPGFAFNWFEGPINAGADLPPRVYDAYIDTAWYPRFTPVIGADLGLRTGVWTDFEAVNDDSVRLLGRALGVITLSPKMDLLAGIWYLDRNRYPMLPAGGLHWKPNTEWDVYAVFPNPKVRKRFVNVGSSQWWWYVAGEYGGGRWTIERDPANFGGMATDDDIDINDIRVIGGLEWETATQARGHIEAGYVFDREIIYDHTDVPPGYAFDLDDTWMIRLGFDF